MFKLNTNMRIDFKYFNNYTIKRLNESNNNYNYTTEPQLKLKTPLKADTVSFGNVPEGKKIKGLYPYGIIDIYTGLPTVDPKVLESMISNKVFEKSIAKIVEELTPYEKALHPVEREMFELIKSTAKLNPKLKLTDIINCLYQQHLQILQNKQKPIFEEILKLGWELPEDIFPEFLEIMQQSKLKLEQIPVVENFNVSEFKYKLDKIAQDILIKNTKQEIKTISRLQNIAKRLKNIQTGPPIIYDANTGEIKRKKKFSERKKQRSRLYEMKKIVIESPLKKNKELRELINNGISSMEGNPTITPFSRKAFKTQLQNLTDKIEDRKLATKILKEATKIPSAHEDLSAFIVKSAQTDAGKIGTRLLYPSLCSIDHIVPASRGGVSNTKNYIIVSTRTNQNLSNKLMPERLRYYPQVYQNAQKVIDQLIDLNEQGVFKKISLGSGYIRSLAKALYKNSPKEHRITVDLSRLD